MSSKFLKYIKISVMLAIIFAFAWFLLVYPTYKFKQYEGQLKEAAERYYEYMEDVDYDEELEKLRL